MACGPITSWQIDGETMKTVADFILWGSKITADGDCSHVIKRCLLLGRKALTNLNSILKSTDITLPTKFHLVKAVFSSGHVWIWDLNYKESWAPKNWCFWTVVLEKTLESSLRVLWTARRSNQPILKESVLNIHWKDCCWGWSSNTLATWCEKLTHWKRPWCWERLKVGEEGDDRGWDGWMASPTWWTWVWVSFGSWWWTGRLACCTPWGHKESDVAERLNWTELNWYLTLTIKMKKIDKKKTLTRH